MKQKLQLGIAFSITLGLLTCNCLAQTAIANQHQMAFALEQQGKYAEAEVAWHHFLKDHPNSAEAYAHLGFLEARQGHYRQAVPLYRHALALDPKMQGLQMNLGLAYFKSDELKEAVQTFSALLKDQPPASPETERLTILIGIAHYGLGEFATAVPLIRYNSPADGCKIYIPQWGNKRGSLY